MILSEETEFIENINNSDPRIFFDFMANFYIANLQINPLMAANSPLMIIFGPYVIYSLLGLYSQTFR